MKHDELFSYIDMKTITSLRLVQKFSSFAQDHIEGDLIIKMPEYDYNIGKDIWATLFAWRRYAMKVVNGKIKITFSVNSKLYKEVKANQGISGYILGYELILYIPNEDSIVRYGLTGSSQHVIFKEILKQEVPLRLHIKSVRRTHNRYFWYALDLVVSKQKPSMKPIEYLVGPETIEDKNHA